jgi:hypothetical protein
MLTLSKTSSARTRLSKRTKMRVKTIDGNHHYWWEVMEELPHSYICKTKEQPVSTYSSRLGKWVENPIVATILKDDVVEVEK